jgi:hypothetical protein
MFNTKTSIPVTKPIGKITSEFKALMCGYKNVSEINRIFGCEVTHLFLN